MTVQSGVATVSSSPWAVEWANKLDVWHLVASLGILPSEVHYADGDCTSAKLGLKRRTLSRCC